MKERMLNRKERWVNEYPARFGGLHRARGRTLMPVTSTPPPPPLQTPPSPHIAMGTMRPHKGKSKIAMGGIREGLILRKKKAKECKACVHVYIRMYTFMDVKEKIKRH